MGLKMTPQFYENLCSHMLTTYRWATEAGHDPDPEDIATFILKRHGWSAVLSVSELSYYTMRLVQKVEGPRAGSPPYDAATATGMYDG